MGILGGPAYGCLGGTCVWAYSQASSLRAKGMPGSARGEVHRLGARDLHVGRRGLRGLVAMRWAGLGAEAIGGVGIDSSIDWLIPLHRHSDRLIVIVIPNIPSSRASMQDYDSALMLPPQLQILSTYAIRPGGHCGAHGWARTPILLV